ncbi:MAG TPA: thiol-activated cytolysin family protein [Polyangiaceae bacterium]|nr:thiol-activated cytolysin family protein [Polyangiaceae bacterium]
MNLSTSVVGLNGRRSVLWSLIFAVVATTSAACSSSDGAQRAAPSSNGDAGTGATPGTGNGGTGNGGSDNGGAGGGGAAGGGAGSGGSAGGGSGNGGGQNPDGGGSGGSSGSLPTDVEDYLDGFAVWGTVPPSSDTPSAAVSELRDLSNGTTTNPFQCSVVTHDVVDEHDEILNLDSGAEYVKPGILLVGDQFQHGNLQPIPLARAPITLSINVPGVQQATVQVENPNVSNIQQGIATLQNNAETAAGGQYAAQLSYEQHSVQSTHEMSYDLGLAAGFDGLFAKANFESKFTNQESEQKYTVVMKLMQQMYTITFAQDDFANPSDFFSPTLTMTDITKAENSGYFGPQNPPVFIGSVTYGRMVIFSATSTQVSSASELETHLQASGTSWSAKADLDIAEKNFLSSLDIQVLAVGGDQAKVTTAIKSGNWSELYADADILSAVPLRYTVHALSGTRPIAAIGDTTQFEVADCDPIQGWYQVPGPAGVHFKDVATNPGNSPVLAIGVDGVGNYGIYQLAGESFQIMPNATGWDTTPLRDVTVDDDGNAYFINDHPVSPYAQIYRCPVGSTHWSGAVWNQASMGAIDAGSANWVIGLGVPYSNNQRDFWTMNWGSDWVYAIDDAQNDVRGDGPFFSAAGNAYYFINWYGSYDLNAVGSNGVTTRLSDNTDEMNKVQSLSVLNANNIFALLNTGEIARYDSTADAWDTKSSIKPPTNRTLEQIEATSNGQFWAITVGDELWRYVP